MTNQSYRRGQSGIDASVGYSGRAGLNSQATSSPNDSALVKMQPGPESRTSSNIKTLALNQKQNIISPRSNLLAPKSNLASVSQKMEGKFQGLGKQTVRVVVGQEDQEDRSPMNYMKEPYSAVTEVLALDMQHGFNNCNLQYVSECQQTSETNRRGLSNSSNADIGHVFKKKGSGNIQELS